MRKPKFQGICAEVYRSKILAKARAMPRVWTEFSVSFKFIWKAEGANYRRNKGKVQWTSVFEIFRNAVTFYMAVGWG